MERVVKGIVMEIAASSAFLMTDDGEFVKVKKPSHSISLGDEITSTVIMDRRKNNMLRYTAIAAAIIILLVPFAYFREAYATVAYVNVDINPSIELGINKYNSVNDAKALNSDGADLLKNISLKGMDIKNAINSVISKAKDDGYMNNNGENNIKVAIIKINAERSDLTEESIIKYVEDAVIQTDVDATIQVRSTDKDTHDSAEKENMSTNKYIDKTQGENSGLKEEVRQPVHSENGGNSNNKNNNNGQDIKNNSPKNDKDQNGNKENDDKKTENQNSNSNSNQKDKHGNSPQSGSSNKNEQNGKK